MATKTREELVNEALKVLHALETGQDAAEEDYDEVDLRVDTLIAQLRADDICDVSDDAEIPAEWFDALSELLANICASKFGMDFSADKKRLFEQFLRRATSPRSTLETLRADYY